MISTMQPKWQLVKAATAMAEECSKSTFRWKKVLGLDSRHSNHSNVLSRLLFWGFCCSGYKRNSIAFAPNVRTTRPRPLGFLGPMSHSHGRSLLFRYDSRPTIRSTATNSAPRNMNFYTTTTTTTRLFSSQKQDQTFSVESLANKLSEKGYSKIVVLVGAGASCSAGIPDFRTPGTGLYDKLDQYKLPMPEAIFDLGYYTQVTPMPFVDLCKDLWPGQEGGPKPTPTHHFLKLLEEKQLLHRIYTQNIDGLEALAGISTDKLVECHGHFRSASCTNCKTQMPINDCRDTMVEEGKPPKCPKCGSLVKPDIVFFGEEMPSRFVDLIDYDVETCDLLMVFGTSLLVMPVAGIPSWVHTSVPRVLFNREPAGGIGSGVSKHLRQDLFLKGDCDDSVKTLCELAGWNGDLRALMDRK